jgi:hypothetical protein
MERVMSENATPKWHGFCDECGWDAPDSYYDKDRAFEETNLHVQNEHAWQWGVKRINPSP